MPSCKFLTLTTMIVAGLSLSACADMAARRALIARSQENYAGVCACPYNVDKAGRACGSKSSYSRYGTAKVMCFGEDVPAEAVEEYKRLHPEK